MKLVAQGLTLAALLATAACTANTNRPTDTGSMQTPVPNRAGIVDPTMRQGRDVGSMQAPTTSGGVRVRESTVPDTGSMAEPAAAQGNSGTRRLVP